MLKPCLGREEVLRASRRADPSRWVTVVGPPGCGKTLLVAHALGDAEHAVWVEARASSTLDELLSLPGRAPPGAGAG